MFKGQLGLRMARRRFQGPLVVVVMVAVALAGVTRSAQSAGWIASQQAKRHRLRPVPVATGSRQVALLRMFPPGGEEADTYYWLVVRRVDSERNRPPTELCFMVGSAEPEKAIFREQISDSFLYALLPEGDSSSLVITVWETGSALYVRAFRLLRNEVRQIFERGSEGAPEFPSDAILLHVGKVFHPDGSYSPERTEVWTWTGEKYKLAATVPFNDRYQALQQLPPSAWK
jgi:hypothetical protein